MREIGAETAIADVVAHDTRTAAVFNRYGIDFCCGGRRAIGSTCAALNLDVDRVLRELREAVCTPDVDADLTALNVVRLIDRVVTTHHEYARAHVPVIREYLDSLAATYGDRSPELGRLAAIFADVGEDLIRHMEREEAIIFPAIRRLAEQGPPASAPVLVAEIEQQVAAHEDEHEWAAAQLALIRALANDFVPPPEACPVWRMCYAELERFEADLHQHVHLENNVLFPAVVQPGPNGPTA